MDFSLIWEKVHGPINGTMASLPNIVLALVVFVIFYAVARGIAVPFPTQQLLLHDQSEATDGDRARQREGWPAGEGTTLQQRSIAGLIVADGRARQAAYGEESYAEWRP